MCMRVCARDWAKIVISSGNKQRYTHTKHSAAPSLFLAGAILAGFSDLTDSNE